MYTEYEYSLVFYTRFFFIRTKFIRTSTLISFKKTKERLQNEKTSYRMTSSLLPFTPARPNLIVTSLKSDKVVFLGPPLRPPERVTIPVTLGGISGTSRTIIKSICSPTANWRQARYQSKLKLQVGLIFISSLGKKSAYVSVFERMTYTIYPPLQLFCHSFKNKRK